MDDYSEFPTTPTGWQERAWQDIAPLPSEEPPPPPRRGVDLIALVPGVVFTVVAIVVMAGVSIPVAIFRDGGLLWLVLIAVGVLMLVGELRKNRRRPR